MATPTIVDAPHGEATASTLDLTTVALNVNDTLVGIEMSDYYDVANMIDPSGGSWSHVVTADLGVNAIHVRSWRKLVTSAGAVTVTFTKINDEDMAAFLYALRGADTVNPVDASAATTGTTTATQAAASVSPSSSDALLINAWGTGNGSYLAFPLAPWSSDGTEDVAPFAEMAAGHEALTSSGSTGTRTAVFDAARDFAAISIAIKGAAAPKGPRYRRRSPRGLILR